MINILNFAAVPFNSPVYERMERGKQAALQALREEVMMEVARELQDLESDVSRILSRDSPLERQNQISRFPIGAKEKALTCLLVPGAREEEDTRGCNGDKQEPCQPSRRKNPEGFRKVAASLICLLLLFSLVKR